MEQQAVTKPTICAPNQHALSAAVLGSICTICGYNTLADDYGIGQEDENKQ